MEEDSGRKEEFEKELTRIPNELERVQILHKLSPKMMEGATQIMAFGVLEAMLDLVAAQLKYLNIALKLFGSSQFASG